MTVTTSLPLPAGIYWQAIILREFVLAVEPTMGASVAPFAHYYLSVDPTLWARPPLPFRLSVAPGMRAAASTVEPASVNLAVTPTMSARATRTYAASVVLAVTPTMAPKAAVVPKPLPPKQNNVAVHRAANW
jgi:hypothetical protein